MGITYTTNEGEGKLTFQYAFSRFLADRIYIPQQASVLPIIHTRFLGATLSYFPYCVIGFAGTKHSAGFSDAKVPVAVDLRSELQRSCENNSDDAT